jgi:hypothetical protein
MPEIWIKTLTGRTFRVEAGWSESISVFLERVKDLFNDEGYQLHYTPGDLKKKNNFRLIYQGRTLPDETDRLLSDIGIRSECEMHLILRLQSNTSSSRPVDYWVNNRSLTDDFQPEFDRMVNRCGSVAEKTALFEQCSRQLQGLLAELSQIVATPQPSNIFVAPNGTPATFRLLSWRVAIRGPQGSPFEDSFVLIRIFFSLDYSSHKVSIRDVRAAPLLFFVFF